MHLGKEKNFITLTFDSTESRAMKRILASVSQNYKIAPAELDAKSATAWYSTRGCETAKMSAEDTHEWIEELHQQRSARIQHLEEWLRQVSVPSTEPCRLKVKLEEAQNLLTVLNDHRLLAAARNEIGQKEMDLLSFQVLNRLRPEQQVALFEIHFLACIIEGLLQFLPGNCSDWQS